VLVISVVHTLAESTTRFGLGLTALMLSLAAIVFVCLFLIIVYDDGNNVESRIFYMAAQPGDRWLSLPHLIAW
jgi:hypothetical protein